MLEQLDPATAATQASRWAFHAGVPMDWQRIRADLKAGDWDPWATAVHRALGVTEIALDAAAPARLISTTPRSPRTLAQLVRLAEGAGYDKPALPNA